MLLIHVHVGVIVANYNPPFFVFSVGFVDNKHYVKKKKITFNWILELRCRCGVSCFPFYFISFALLFYNEIVYF